MNKAHGITKENLLASLPAVLANDDNMAALASAVAEVLAARVGEIERVSIYSQIDPAPERACWTFWRTTSRLTGGTPTTPWRKSAGR